jgi:hypothetical protein
VGKSVRLDDMSDSMINHVIQTQYQSKEFLAKVAGRHKDGA